MLRRRGFLFLLGVGVPAGLWLPETGLVTISRTMVLELVGACSFCDAPGSLLRALAGVVGRPHRICNECVELAGQIVAMESHRAAELPVAAKAPEDLDADER